MAMAWEPDVTAGWPPSRDRFDGLAELPEPASAAYRMPALVAASVGVLPAMLLLLAGRLDAGRGGGLREVREPRDLRAFRRRRRAGAERGALAHGRDYGLARWVSGSTMHDVSPTTTSPRATGRDADELAAAVRDRQPG